MRIVHIAILQFSSISHQTTREMHFDDAISNVGAVGLYQILIIIIFLPITFLPSSITVSTVFTSAASQFNCSDSDQFYSWQATNEVKNLENTTQTQCMSNKNGTLDRCTSWTYSKTPYTSTAISQYNLVCHNAYIVPLIRTAYMFGILVGGLTYGMLSDKVGRIWSFILASLNTGVAGVLAPFAPTSIWYAFGRFAVALGVSGMMTITPPLLLEITTTKHRLHVFMITKYGWSLGCAYCSAVAYFVRSHAELEIIMAAPAMVIIILMLMYPESPRWLYAKGHTDRSIEVLQFIGRFNKKSLSEKFHVKLNNLKDMNGEPAKLKDSSLFDMLRDRVLRRVLIVTWIVFAVIGFIYYGLLFASSEYSHNLYLYVFIGSMVESQTVTLGIFVGSKFGRVVWLALGMSLAAVSCMCCVFVSSGWLFSVLTTLGRFFILLSYFGIWFYTAEVFPTVVRAACVGSGSMCSRFGAMTAPLMMYAHSFGRAIPFIIYAALCVFVTLSLIFLPETKDIESPDTLAEARTLYKCYFFKKSRGNPKIEANVDDASTQMVA